MFQTIKAKGNGLLEIDELRTIEKKGDDGETKVIVVGRSAELENHR
jgi:hypothetical protein